jgi:hypothetical protein
MCGGRPCGRQVVRALQAWDVVVNPHAGAGRGARLADEVARQLPRARVVTLPASSDLTQALREATAGPRCWPSTRRLGRRRVYTEAGSAGLRVSLPDGPAALASGGETGPGSAELRFGTARRALTVYRPTVRRLL